MDQLDRNLYSIRELNNCLQKNNNIIIYGAGDFGKQLIDYLYIINKQQKIQGIVITRKGIETEYRGIKIFAASDYFDMHKECFVIVAASQIYQGDIAQVVEQNDRQYCCIADRLYYAMKRRTSDLRPVIPYQGVGGGKIDFICAGFVKCGTTSVYNALRKVKSVYLSERKENHYFQWCDKVDNPEKLLAENFFDDVREGQKVGMVDPTYTEEASKICSVFGNTVKIILLVRNPVDAAFSSFKMAARQGLRELDMAYEKNGGSFSVNFFDEHFEKDKVRFRFINAIKKYEEYFGKNQMKIVLLEELINKPQIIIDDILDFIGTSERYMDEKLPLENEGRFVMADLDGYRLARLRRQMGEVKWNNDLRGKKSGHLDLNIEEQYAAAPKIYGVKITDNQRRQAEEYFNSSVRELEEWLDRDLSQVWF